MALLTQILPPEELAKLTPAQQQQVEDHIDGLVIKTLMTPNVMQSLTTDVRGFASKLTAPSP